MSNSNPAKTGSAVWKSLETLIAAFTVIMITAHLILRYGTDCTDFIQNLPLWSVLALGGTPLVWGLLVQMVHRERMPSVAHKKMETDIQDIALDQIAINDSIAIFPHEICPVDGIVIEGHGVMDESYLTGEPYMMSKTPGSQVLSGAINGEAALVIRAEKRAVDSRYAKIMQVMQSSEQHRPRMRRMADRLGAWYTPLAVLIGLAAWIISGDPVRFLAVMVVATPCPLLIAIPVAIIGSISLAARRAIIVRDPTALETADTCRVIIFDKTGTLTYGEPHLTDQLCAPGFNPLDVLSLVGSLERFSKHPLAGAILQTMQQANTVSHEATEISEPPGQGMQGTVDGHTVQITSRKKLLKQQPELEDQLPPQAGGLECVILIDDQYAGIYRFRDTPRTDGQSFISHLSPRHQIQKTMLVSGDRESEVRYLAEQVGIENVYFSQSPEQKLKIVNSETSQANTIFVGDGINDAPALMAATVGMAFGQNSDVTTEAADVIVMDSSLQKIDEFLHISRRMRRIALQSAIGGMALSMFGMLLAAFGYLPPVAGALSQEVIDVLAVLNALRVAIPAKALIDFNPERPA